MGGSRGIAQTLLSGDFNSTGTHPDQQMELLNKIFNNVTMRSNTFAVWLTVGFFPVVNDQVQPVELGPEYNLANGRNIRHHMFAIVDRTQIVTFGSLNTGDPTAVHYTGPGIPCARTPLDDDTLRSSPIQNPITDNRTGHTWQIQGADADSGGVSASV